MRLSVPRLLLAIPFVLVALGAVAARRAVPKVGDRIGRHLSSAANALRLNASPPWKQRNLLPPSIAPSPSPVIARPDLTSDSGLAPETGPVAVRVPAKLVQRAIDDQGAHIRATETRGPDGAPAGLVLSGVSGLGVGLRDGDVIVALEGSPALDAATATDTALAAIAREKPLLHATAMRGDVPVSITLELPPEPRASR